MATNLNLNLKISIFSGFWSSVCPSFGASCPLFSSHQSSYDPQVCFQHDFSRSSVQQISPGTYRKGCYHLGLLSWTFCAYYSLIIVCCPTEEAFFEMLSSSSLCLQRKVMAPCWGLCHIIISLFVFSLSFFSKETFYRGRVSSVGRVLDCRAGGRGFDFRR